MKTLLKLHRHLGILFSLPLLVVGLTGILLLLRSFFPENNFDVKKEKLSIDLKVASIETVMKKTQTYYSDLEPKKIKSIRYDPQKKHFKILTSDSRQLILSADSLKVIHEGKRWTSLIVKIHEGSFWGKPVQYSLYLGTGIGLLFLAVSGVVLYFTKKKKLKSFPQR